MSSSCLENLWKGWITHPSSVSNSIQCSDIPAAIFNYLTCNLLLNFIRKRKKKTHINYECQLKHQLKTSVLEKRKPDPFSLATTGDREEGGRVSGASYIKTFPLTNGNQPHGPGSLLQISRALIQGMSPTNNQRQTTLPCLSAGQRQPETSNREQFKKCHTGGTGANDFVSGFIDKNPASAYQFLFSWYNNNM